MQELFLLAQIDGTEVVICSDIVESVVTVGEVVTVPGCEPVVAGLFALRSRVLTLIDCQYRVTGKRQPAERGMLAIIAGIGGHNFGLLVEKVFDVVPVEDASIHPAVKLDPRWKSLVSRLVEIDGRMVMALDPDALVAVDTALAA
jgi:purine-binding chemotaxis protein CheW